MNLLSKVDSANSLHVVANIIYEQLIGVGLFNIVCVDVLVS